MNFEGQILDAAKSIATATGALVKAASVAQRELITQGKVGEFSKQLLQWNLIISLIEMIILNKVCLNFQSISYDSHFRSISFDSHFQSI